MTRTMPMIVGVPRSGTTLLRMMIDAHPDVAIPPETGFLPALAALDQTSEGSCAGAIITGVHTWPDFQIEAQTLLDAIEARASMTPAGAARLFYRLYAARFGKSRWGDKTPTYGSEIDRIASLLPEARFIHIIRDGRDVMLSVRNLWFRPGDTVEACATDWTTRLSRTRDLGSRVPHYLEIRYESLVMNPEDLLREVCDFLELSFAPSMLRYYLRSGTRLEEHEALYGSDGQMVISKAARVQNQRLVMEPPRADRIDRWRSELSDTEVVQFEAVAGEWLERLGYARRSRV